MCSLLCGCVLVFYMWCQTQQIHADININIKMCQMELNSVLAYTFWADIIYMKKSLRGSYIASPAKALQQHANKCSTEWGGKSKYLFISHHPVSCQACGKRFHQAASPSWCSLMNSHSSSQWRCLWAFSSNSCWSLYTMWKFKDNPEFEFFFLIDPKLMLRSRLWGGCNW